MARPSKLDPAVLCSILDMMVLNPASALNHTAQRHGISAATVYRYTKLSIEAERAGDTLSDLHFEWPLNSGNESYWHRHCNFSRAISISTLDATIRESATQPHRKLLTNMQTGEPHWQRDPKIAADALSLSEFDWEMEYGMRKRSDTFVRDEHGALVQAFELVPPNPKLMMDAAKALLKDTYGEVVSHNVNVGGVLRISAESAPALAPPIDAEFTELPKPTNVLAVGQRAETSAEFEQAFGGKRIVEAVLFYGDDGKLLPPRAEIVIVFGSSIHRAYSRASIPTSPIMADNLIAQGYKNEFLMRLAAPLSNLERDLRDKLAAGPVNPHPRSAPAPVTVKSPAPAPRDPDAWRFASDRDHLGVGTPRPGGAKVV